MALTPNGAKLQKLLTAQVGKPYAWAKEDCSELFYDVMGPEGFGLVRSRVTADSYYRMGVRISKPSEVGDYFVELDANGHAHHIGMFFGPDAHGALWTVEARGKDYGTPKYRLNDAHNGVTARHGIWMRLKTAHLGGFMAAAPKPPVVPPAPPVTPPAPKPAPAPAPKPKPLPTMEVVVPGLRMRAKPRTLLSKILVDGLAIHTHLSVRARSGAWILTSYRGTVGWVCTRSATGKTYVR